MLIVCTSREGINAVLHLALPFTLKKASSEADAIKNVVEPAVAGAMNVVKAADILGLKRLVNCQLRVSLYLGWSVLDLNGALITSMVPMM